MASERDEWDRPRGARLPNAALPRVVDVPTDAPSWAIDRRLPQPAGYLEEGFARLLHVAEGAAHGREGLTDTARRAAAAWRELVRGYGMTVDLRTFAADGYDEMVAVSRLPFYSTCEHHLLSFHGTADFVYLPGERIVGLSKFARLLEMYSRRLQVQERLSREMADELERQVAPRGVMVVVRAEHLCMACRGVEAAGHVTSTSETRGAFRHKPETRAEAMALLDQAQRA